MRGPVAVVTGAGSGIGRHIAQALLGAEYRVVLVGRTRARLDESIASCPPSGGRALVVPADMSVDADVAAVFDRVVDAWGRVDLLVNNAGTFGPGGEIDELEPDDWRRTIEVNLTGAFLCARQAVRIMKRQEPRGANHQQRFHLGAAATSGKRGLHGDQACDDRADQVDLAGRPSV